KMKLHLREQLDSFIKAQKLVLGVCNGFQIMVKMGLLPVPDFEQRVSLTTNDSGHYEDRWVILKANKQSPCIFTKGLDYMFVPVRHGEGKFIPKDEAILRELKEKNQVVFQYTDEKGNLAGFPYNPNGSVYNVAGICDSSGRVFGMMPHPEAFNIIETCPAWVKGGIKEPLGLSIFRNAAEYAKEF